MVISVERDRPTCLRTLIDPLQIPTFCEAYLMRTPIALLALATALLTSLASSPPAQACDGYGGGIGNLYRSLEYRVPYFAAHPPVYYSHPVPRTYGHSPFAYPPHFRTPEVVEQVQPVTISNPYVPKVIKSKTVESKAVKRSTDQTVSHPTAAPTVKPLVILNPYAVDSPLAHNVH